MRLRCRTALQTNSPLTALQASGADSRGWRRGFALGVGWLGLWLAGPVLAATPAGGHPTAYWEPQIQAFEAADQTNPPPKGAILFVGSSSIRMWKDITTDFGFSPVISRGFGGSQMIDTARFADRIVIPYEPRQVYVYAGDNDLANGKSPEEIAADFHALATNVLQRLPRTRLAYISIKPSLARRHLLDKIRRTNELIRDYCRRRWRLHFVDVYTPMLDEAGEPRPDLFARDGLHLNRKGYDLWVSIIAPHIRRWLAPPVRGGSEPTDQPPEFRRFRRPPPDRMPDGSRPPPPPPRPQATAP